MMSLKNILRLNLLKLAKANIIVTQDVFLFDENKKLLLKKSKVADSLVGNFLQVLYTNYANGNTTNFLVSSFNGGNNGSTKNISGSNVTSSNNTPLNSGVGVTNVGIQFGTGSTAVTALDYKLQTLIANGPGVGQLSYIQQQSSQAPVNVAGVVSFKLLRLAVNNSGGAITVNEVGISAGAGDNSNPGFLIYRDLTGGVLVNAGQTISCEITFSITT